MKRVTAQRKAIYRVIEGSKRPLGVQEIHERTKKRVPSISLATIYRNLKQLVREGSVVQVSYPPIGTVYEPAGKPHHHHFHCRLCGRLLELEGCALDEDVRLPEGFSVEGHELFIYGTCDDCG